MSTILVSLRCREEGEYEGRILQKRELRKQVSAERILGREEEIIQTTKRQTSIPMTQRLHMNRGNGEKASMSEEGLMTGGNSQWG